MKKWRTKKGGVIFFLVFLCLVGGFVCIKAMRPPKKLMQELTNPPSVTLTSPKGVKPGVQEEIAIDVLVADLPKQFFPSASLSIRFDEKKLELLRIDKGDLPVGNGENVPEWQGNVPAANKTGTLHLLYLDETLGSKAYTSHEKKQLLRLIFRLTKEAKSGEIYRLVIEDAVFAAMNTEDALSVLKENLRIYHAQIVVL